MEKQTEQIKNNSSNISGIDAELHYNSLLAFFKNLVWLATIFITIIIGLSAAFLFKSIADIKSEIAEVKETAKQAINNTKELTDLQISNIQEKASKIAIDEARSRVEEAFRSTNIMSLVESAAEKQVGVEIEKQVQNKVVEAFDAIQRDITILGKIADAGMKMRIGIRSGLDELIELQKNSKNENVRLRAKVMLESIAFDYERACKEILNEEKESKEPISFYQKMSQNEFKEGSNTITGLIKVIHTENDLTMLGMSFLGLRDLTGYPFKMFDIVEVDNWCKMNPDKCSDKK